MDRIITSSRDRSSLLSTHKVLRNTYFLLSLTLAFSAITHDVMIVSDESGKILRARTGIEFSYENQRPVVKLKGVTIMGIPIPNAWLGGLKNIDLVQEFGSADGFWKAFSDGVAAVKVEEGALRLRLHE